jgi:hypothetical protein
VRLGFTENDPGERTGEAVVRAVGRSSVGGIPVQWHFTNISLAV